MCNHNNNENYELAFSKLAELVVKEKGSEVTISNDSTCRQLIKEAIKSLEYAYTPYSNHKVGAALLTKDLKIYRGCNVENAAFTPTNCAERTAYFKAVSEGHKEFMAIAIVGGMHGILKDYCAPCGVCRQVMMEFGDPKSFLVILAKSEDDYKVYTLEEILPFGFGPNNL